jgi:hypothetical protein
MAQKKDTGFWYRMHPNGTATIGFNRQIYGTILIAPEADIEITISFFRKLEALYVAYYKQGVLGRG